MGTSTLVWKEHSDPTHGPVLVVQTIPPHAVYPLHIHTSLDGRCAFTDGLGPVVPTKLPNILYLLHIQTRLDGCVCTHSRASTRCGNNNTTCLISSGSLKQVVKDGCAREHGTGPVMPTIRLPAVDPLHIHGSRLIQLGSFDGKLMVDCLISFSQALTDPQSPPVRVNSNISFKRFLCR